MEPDDDSVYETGSLIDNIKTLRFRLGLQSFTYIDEPYIFQVDFPTKKFEPIDNTNNEEFVNIDEIIPEYMVPTTNESTESSTCRVSKINDFSFHKKGTGVIRSLHSKNHRSIMTLKGETADGTIELINEDTTPTTLNASEDSSDDESYDENDHSDSSDDDDDTLIGAVNIKDVNMRQYGKSKSTAYSVENMIIAVKIIYQQELGVVKCLASRKDKAKKLILPQRKVEFSR